MKKDIEIPEVEKVYIAAVKEFNKEFGAEEWNAYIINEREEDLETVLIVTRGFEGEKQTSTMRHNSRSCHRNLLLKSNICRMRYWP